MTGDTEAWLITDRFFAVAERDPERELIVDGKFGRLSYGEVAEEVGLLAQALTQHGLGRGDMVLLQLPNWAPFITFHLALTVIGAVTINIPVTFREREVGGILAMTEAKALIVPDEFRGFKFLPFAEKLAPACPALSRIFLVERNQSPCSEAFAIEGGLEVVTYAQLMGRADPSLHWRDIWAAMDLGLDKVTTLTFTSGTTGGLKGAIHDSRTLAAINTGFIERHNLNERDCILGASPFGHAVGFTHAVRMTLSIGAKIVLLEYWDPGQALELMHREGCTFVAGATPFLMDLLYHPDLAKYGHLPTLRLFLCGGAAVPEQLIHDALYKLPHALVSPSWGMSECGGVTTCPPGARKEKFLETDGVPCGGMEVKVVGPDMAPLPKGSEGELLVRGPMLAKGYYRQPDLTKDLFLPDGFFRTGDQARMDEDGYIKITGRIKDLIIRGGVNISPVDIESVLFSHPKVHNAAVVGVPDERLGERICAFVIPMEGETIELAETQEWMAKSGLAKQKWPERIEVVDVFPLTPSGKIQKFKLKERLAQG
jgi:acyl-CoA synthetase (AMP-forming)/AMP-acid ligase II